MQSSFWLKTNFRFLYLSYMYLAINFTYENSIKISLSLNTLTVKFILWIQHLLKDIDVARRFIFDKHLLFPSFFFVPFPLLIMNKIFDNIEVLILFLNKVLVLFLIRFLYILQALNHLLLLSLEAFNTVLLRAISVNLHMHQWVDVIDVCGFNPLGLELYHWRGGRAFGRYDIY